MPLSDAIWVDALVATAGQLTTARGGTFATQTDIEVEAWDEIAFRVAALDLPVATKVYLYPMHGDSAKEYGYGADLGGTDRPLEAPKADFVTGTGKVLPCVSARVRHIKIDATVDATDPNATITVQYLRSRPAMR